MNREKTIVQTSLIGILTNFALVGVKIMIGLLSNSIAIILDAVNNLADALSSVITVIGAKLAGRRPDHDHPFGYGRIEYITSIIIGCLITYAGVTSIKESIEAIIHPVETTYSIPLIITIIIGIIVKVFLGTYTEKQGKKVNHDGLIASGKEQQGDAILSVATLVSALLKLFANISIESYLATVLSLVIVKAGVEVLKDTFDNIIGTRESFDLSVNIKKDVASIPGVSGAYDLVLHDYGPNDKIGSIHIEVDDTCNARQIHLLTYQVQKLCLEKYGFEVTVGIYASNSSDPRIIQMKEEIANIIYSRKEHIPFHGLFVDFDTNYMSFDIVVDFKYDSEKIKEEVILEIQKIYPQFMVQINIDTSYTD